MTAGDTPRQCQDRPLNRWRWTWAIALTILYFVGGVAAASPSKRKSESPSTAVPIVVVSCQQRDDHPRISLRWPAPVGYRISRQGQRITLEFPKPAHLETSSLHTADNHCGHSVTTETTATGTVLAFDLPEEMAARDVRLDNTLIIDLFRRPARPSAAARVNEAPPADLSMTSDVPGPPSPGPSPPPPADPLIEPADHPVASAPSDNPSPAPSTPQLRFGWSTPSAAAVFRRGTALWLVFDHPSRLDAAALLRAAAAPQIAHIEQRPHPRATVLRLQLAADLDPVLERSGNAWIVRFVPPPQPSPTAPITANPDRGNHGRMRLLLPVAEPGEPLAVTDPEVGDNLVVVPLRGLGSGVTRGYDFQQLQLLPSIQGIVVQPLSDDVWVRSFAEGVEISRPEGLALSPVSDFDRALAAMSLAPAGSRILSAGEWPPVAPRNFADQLSERVYRLSHAAEANRARELAELARFYVGAGLGAEALGTLDRLAQSDPATVNDPQARLLRGIANWLIGRNDAASREIRQPDIEGSDEGRLWRSLIDGTKMDPAGLPGWTALLASYPPLLRQAVGPALLKAAVDAGPAPTAADLLANLRIVVADAAAHARFAYQEGRMKAMSGDVDGAVAAWQPAIDSDTADASAQATFDRVQLLRREGRMPVQEAIDTLDRLRVTWRGDELEFQAMRMVGELQAGENDNLAALRTWRALVSLYPQNPASREIADKMSDLFVRTLTDPTTSAIPPWKAVALFDEFKELVPDDGRGRALLSGYADRLIAADLRPQAATVLEKLKLASPSDADKAKTALRLAKVYLADGKPEPALTMAGEADRPELSGADHGERRLIAAAALIALQRYDEALAMIANEPGVKADTIRLAAYRGRGDWSAAAAMLQRLGDTPTDPAAAAPNGGPSRLLDAAAALVLADDPEGLSRLRQAPDRPPPDTPAGQALDLMTRPEKAIAPKAESIAAAVADAEKLAATAKRTLSPPAPPSSTP